MHTDTPGMVPERESIQDHRATASPPGGNGNGSEKKSPPPFCDEKRTFA